MPAIDIARGVALASTALVVGAVVFTVLAWLPALREAMAREQDPAAHADLHDGCDAFFARVASIVLAASLAGLAATALILTTGDLTGTREPVAWAVGATSFGVLAGSALGIPRAREIVARSVPVAGASAAAAALIVVPGLSGNAASGDPAAVLVAANAVHVFAASVWIGGIACLLLAVRPGLAPLPPPARSGQLVAVTAGFSALALLAVAALALTGVIQGLLLVGRIESLVTTGYGRLVLIKGALLCLLALAGAAHRSRTLPALRAAAAAGEPPGAASAALRRLLGGEAVVLTLVLIVTGFLAAATPASSGAESASAQSRGRLGAFDVLLTARPGRPGINELTISLSVGSATGPARLAAGARQRRLGVGPVALSATRTAAGRFRIDGASLPAPGTWEITLVVDGSRATRLSLRLR